MNQQSLTNKQQLVAQTKYGNTCVIIPCYNEEECIVNLIKKIHDVLPDCKIIVIDDCSTDSSGSLIEKTGLAEVVKLPINLGIGGTAQTGFKYAVKYDFEYLLRLDGDGQHPPEFGLNLLEPLLKNEADCVIGSRFVSKKDGFRSTLLRRIGIRWFNLLNKLIIKQYIKDSTSGFRAYNRRLIDFLANNYPAFDYPEPEEIILLGKNDFILKEIGVKMKERGGGRSSISSLKSVYYMLKVTFSIFMVAIRPKIKK